MSDAKQEVLKMIAKRQGRNTAIRNRENKRVGLYGIVSDFIVAMEKITSETPDAITFEYALTKEMTMMERRIKSIDPSLEKLEIVWHKPDLMEKMEDLKIEGVRVTWSGFYMSKHPLELKEKYIDVMTLFLANHLQDMPE